MGLGKGGEMLRVGGEFVERDELMKEGKLIGEGGNMRVGGWEKGVYVWKGREWVFEDVEVGGVVG